MAQNYARFYALLKQLPGQYEGIKEDIVHQHTGGRTTSLRAMYDDEYKSLIKYLNEKVNSKPAMPGKKRVWSNSNLDHCRKRVIAAIYGYYGLLNKHVSTKYVISTACRAAKCKEFNLIPASDLHKVYNVFTAKQRDIKKALKAAKNDLSKVHLN